MHSHECQIIPLFGISGNFSGSIMWIWESLTQSISFSRLTDTPLRYRQYQDPTGNLRAVVMRLYTEITTDVSLTMDAMTAIRLGLDCGEMNSNQKTGIIY